MGARPLRPRLLGWHWAERTEEASCRSKAEDEHAHAHEQADTEAWRRESRIRHQAWRKRIEKHGGREEALDLRFGAALAAANTKQGRLPHLKPAFRLSLESERPD